MWKIYIYIYYICISICDANNLDNLGNGWSVFRVKIGLNYPNQLVNMIHTRHQNIGMCIQLDHRQYHIGVRSILTGGSNRSIA